jgi:hypothetical protein
MAILLLEMEVQQCTMVIRYPSLLEGKGFKVEVRRGYIIAVGAFSDQSD